MLRCLLILLFALLCASPAGADDWYEEERAFWESTPPGIVPAAAEPAWIAKAVAALPYDAKYENPDRHHLLLRPKGHPSWLLVFTYPNDSHMARRYSLYRLDGQKLTKKYEEDYVSFYVRRPTGTLPFGDGRVLLVLWRDAGGTAYTTKYLKVLALGRDLKDLTPPDTSGFAMEDMDGDGIPELVTYDDHWEIFYSSCGACGLWITTVWHWEKHHYVPACQRYPDWYKRRIAHQREWMAEDHAGTTAIGRMGDLMDIALHELQSGDISQARASYQDALKEISAMKDDRFRDDVLKSTRRFLGPLFQKANPKAACPANIPKLPKKIKYDSKNGFMGWRFEDGYLK